MDHEPTRSRQWQAWRARVDLTEYDERWDRMAATGAAVHGEADAVCRLGATRALDAGCGTGRVAVELSRRGLDVWGVDNDPDMVELARPKSSAVTWVVDDLASVHLGTTFDVIVMAGNVLLFVEEGSESAIVANLARHLDPGGHLIAGFQLDGRLPLDAYDAWCERAELSLTERWANWDGDAHDDADYAVSVHRMAAPRS
ncbi:MAG: class I SAM-dependent methyltransferase [Acidimicrobiia bacterium]|nr:class I SAM-dependent methyltransferase [Acidimicrobiia bacterium]